jgi:hypothetical protein
MQVISSGILQPNLETLGVNEPLVRAGIGGIFVETSEEPE